MGTCKRADGPVAWIASRSRADLIVARDVARFERHVEKVAGCWLWRGTLTRDGYGRMNLNQRIYLAHRVAYTVAYGRIPDGRELDHLCRTHACVRPEHLEAVTRAQHNPRGMSPSALNGRKTQCRNGHALSVENTYVPPTGGRTCRICKREKENAAYYRHHDSRLRKMREYHSRKRAAAHV